MSDKKYKILLVDDEVDILEFISYNLEKEDYKVYTAQNGVEAIKIAESGIHNANDIHLLKEKGFHGFLIGERFMKHALPERECKRFVEQLKAINYA